MDTEGHRIGSRNHPTGAGGWEQQYGGAISASGLDPPVRHYAVRSHSVSRDGVVRVLIPCLDNYMHTRFFLQLPIVVLLMAVTACHGLLEVSDPTRIDDSDIANAGGANGRRLDASNFFSDDFASVIDEVAWFTDEWTDVFPASTDVSSSREILLDQRDGDALQALGGNDVHLGLLDRIYVQTSMAIPSVRSFTPDSLRGDFLAQLYAIRAYAVLQMAEDLCPGFPINDVADNLPVYGGPVTTDSALALASGLLDSALKYVVDSARFATLARVAKARVLLDQGHFSDAGAMVAPILTSAVYATDHQAAVMPYRPDPSTIQVAMGNQEGINGLPFVAANDPRIPLFFLSVSQRDPADSLYITFKGYASGDRTIFASGIEARLIQAEVALHDGSLWKPILDSLRATVGLDSLDDPGTSDGRVDLIYRERAFWLYMTGHRLGDLRRLVTIYGRPPESVFPTGPYHGGDGSRYGTSTAIPFILADQRRYNPHINAGCQSS